VRRNQMKLKPKAGEMWKCVVYHTSIYLILEKGAIYHKAYNVIEEYLTEVMIDNDGFPQWSKLS